MTHSGQLSAPPSAGVIAFRALLFSLFTGILLLSACRKEKDELPPDITIFHPGIDVFYQVGDTVYVTARAQDDTRLEWMRFELVNDAFNPVIPVIELPMSGTDSGELSRAIIISNLSLPSGTYYFKVSAFDGENIGTAFRRTLLSELPLALEEVFLLRGIGIAGGIVERLDGNEWQNAAGLPFVPSLAAVNSRQSEIAIAESMSGRIHWFSLPDFTPVRTTEYLSAGDEEFWTDVRYSPEAERYACGSTDGYVRLFKPGGSDALAAALPPNMRAGSTLLHGDYILAETESINLQNRGISVFLRSTGVLQHSASTNFDIIEFFALDENRALVLANQNGQGVVRVYDIAANGFEFPLGINAVNIRCAATDGAGRFVFADDSGIRSFYYNGNDFSQLFGSISGNWKRIRHNKASLAFYALGEGEVILFDGALQQYASWPCDDAASDLELLYNR